MSAAIKIQDLRKVYRNTDLVAVDSIDLVVEKGEFFGLLGPNGAGKTTAVSIISTLMKPTSGNVEINGINIESDLSEIRKQIGVVPQEISLYPKLNAYENLQFFGNMYEMKNSELKFRINELLDVFGLKDKARQQVKTYSGGMKRRLNLIVGILHNPDIVFLDEPTVGIDVQSRKVIMKYLEELQEKGMTLVYTSHHMEEAEKYCSRIAIIDHGRIITMGNPAELIKSNEGCDSLEDIFLKLTGRTLRD